VRRLVRDAIGWTLDGNDYEAAPTLAIGTPQIDDTGRAAVGIQCGDEDGTIRALLISVRDSAERPVVTLRWFDDDEMILGPVTLYLHEPTVEGSMITAEARSRNDDDLSVQPAIFTLENTPTLRGAR
jgi:hypothetical protein